MHPRRLIPILIALVANAVLGLILQEINHYLSIFSLQILLPVCFVLYAGLNISYYPGLLISLFAGLLQDAALPTPPGYFMIALPILHLVIHRLSPKLHKEGGIDSIFLTQILNLLLMLHLAFLFHQQFPSSFLPSFLQIMASQLLLLLVGPTHLAIQVAVSAALGSEVNEEEMTSA